MRTYDHDPRLFDDCDRHRIPHGEPGYDAFLDTPLPKLRLADLLCPATLAVRQAIVDGRLKRAGYVKRFEHTRDDTRRIKLVLGRTA